MAGAEGQRPVQTPFVGHEDREVDPEDLPRSLTSGNSCSASASWGTHLGWTKLVASMVVRPESARRRMNSALTSVGTVAFSFCSPSRAPTS